MPFFTYTDNIPFAPDNPSDDQPLMQTNTNSVDGIIGVDHFSFMNSNGGLHQQVTMFHQAAPGFPNGGEGIYYCDNTGGKTWPAFQNASGAFFLATQQPSYAANGYTSVGSLIIQWGVVASPGSTGKVIFGSPPNGTGNIPFPATLLGVWFNFSRNASSTDSFWIDSTQTFDKTTFSWKASTGTATNLYWLAIGL